MSLRREGVEDQEYMPRFSKHYGVDELRCKTTGQIRQLRRSTPQTSAWGIFLYKGVYLIMLVSVISKSQYDTQNVTQTPGNCRCVHKTHGCVALPPCKPVDVRRAAPRLADEAFWRKKLEQPSHHLQREFDTELMRHESIFNVRFQKTLV